MTEKHECNGQSCSGCSNAGQNKKPTLPPQPPQNEDFDQTLEQIELNEQMAQIRFKILVLSGKGGVGKSTVAVNLATALCLQGYQVGLLDVDIHGPSVPKLLNLQGQPIQQKNGKMVPVNVGENLKVMSLGFLLRKQDDAVIWRGPMKMGVIKQFLKDVLWGPLDFLVVDLPPGTGDEPLSVCQLIENADGAIVVTTPQEIALADVRKSIQFCRQLNLPVLGVLENMSGFLCPHCGTTTDIFLQGGGEKMAKEMNVPFLGRIPLDPQITLSCEEGKPHIYHYSKTPAAKAFNQAIQPILNMAENSNQTKEDKL